MNHEVASKLVHLYGIHKATLDGACQQRGDQGRSMRQSIWNSIAASINGEFGKEYTIRQMKKKLQNMYASIRRKIGDESGAIEMTAAKRMRLTDGENQLLDLVGPNDVRFTNTSYQEDLNDEPSHPSETIEHISANMFLEQMLQQHHSNGADLVNLPVESPPSSSSSTRKRSNDGEDLVEDFQDTKPVPFQPVPDIDTPTETTPFNFSNISNISNMFPVNIPLKMDEGRRQGRRKTHPVWNFFRSEAPPGIGAICLICNTKIAHGVSTSLCRHVLSKHPEYRSQVTSGAYNGNRPPSHESIEDNQMEQDQPIVNGLTVLRPHSNRQDVHNLVAKVLMRDSNVNILEDEAFQDILKRIPNYTPPTATSLVSNLSCELDKFHTYLSERIYDSSSIVPCANVIRRDETHVIVILSSHMVNLEGMQVDRFVVDAIKCNKSALNTAIIAEMFMEFQTKFPGITDKINNYFVCSETNMVPFVVKLKGGRKTSVDQGKATHTLTDVSQDAMIECAAPQFWSFFDCFYNYEPMKQVLDKLDSLAEGVKRSNAEHDTSDIFSDCPLPGNNDWSSKLAFYEFLHQIYTSPENKFQVNPRLPKLTSHQKNLLEFGLGYLKFVRSFLDQMRTPGYPTISMIVPSVLALQQRLTVNPEPQNQEFWELINEAFKAHFSVYLQALTPSCPENDRFYLLSSFLDRRSSFYLTLEYKERAAEWLHQEFEQTSVEQNGAMHEEDEADKNDPFSELEKVAMGAKKPVVKGLCEEVRTYMDQFSTIKVRKNFSSIGFWKDHSTDLPRLTCKALQMLAIPTGIEFAEAEALLGRMSDDADVIPIRTVAMKLLNQQYC